VLEASSNDGIDNAGCIYGHIGGHICVDETSSSSRGRCMPSSGQLLPTFQDFPPAAVAAILARGGWSFILGSEDCSVAHGPSPATLALDFSDVSTFNPSIQFAVRVFRAVTDG
jgi:hypothetical protein